MKVTFSNAACSVALACNTLIILAIWTDAAMADKQTFYRGYRGIRTYPHEPFRTESLDFVRRDDHGYSSRKPTIPSGGSIKRRTTRQVPRTPEFSFWGDVEKLLARREPHLDLKTARLDYRLIKRFLASKNISSQMLISDLSRFFKYTGDQDKCADDIQNPGSLLSFAETKSFWTCYHSADVINEFLEQLAKTYPTLATVEVIGKTWEGREIKAIKINSGAGAKNSFWIDGGMHAREWISPAVATYIAHDLIKNYQDNKQIVDSFVWYIAPVLNVDGYEYSRDQDRMWRKTRTKVDPASKCVGIDANRNFNFKWMVGGSQDVCSEVYAGPAPEVDPMVVALKNFIMKLNSGGNLVAFYTLHAYGQLWGCPWGWTDKEVPETFSQLMRVASVGTQALKKVHGTKYDIGTTAQLGLIGGASDDWAFAVAKVPFVYTIELRDSGEYNFALPANQILPTSEETCEGVKASAMEIKKILDEKTLLKVLLDNILVQPVRTELLK